ncbi:MAG: hypothetical protein BWY43_00281 [candidate division WS2 bacterium ADurb.Bin280]|uniref:Uncharacterized protein n=1 Tax=candidate division WS2 bacterium ADurb.Bin280 TaxID=1852829 RepID=A0A1V5SEF0_9BACT|nr:MAG: hypothetical protein BWY43_00281 [candidate division WS2 bacterium ADurb.Bin280]
MRSAAEIRARCSPIHNNEKLVGIVVDSASPTAAYDLVYQETSDEYTSRAARWLAVLRRDHPEEYESLLNSNGMVS